MENTLPKKTVGKGMRPVHRIVGTIIMLFTLYIGATGLMIQSVDLKAILSHAAATDPEMQAIRESIDGTGNFSVIAPTDYAAPALPADFDFYTAMSTVLKSAQESASADTSLKYLEFRVLNGKPIGLLQAGDKTVRVDPATGTVLPNPPARPRGGRPISMHQTFKNWHRASILSDKWEFLNALVGIGLFTMIVTGLLLYFQLLRARNRAGLNQVFWSAGGWWRSTHRAVSIVAAVFLLVVSISGTLLSLDTFALGIYGMTHSSAGRYSRFPYGMIGDLSSPIPEAKLPGMLSTTLSAFRAAKGEAPIKVLRLRSYSGMPQGLIVSGGDRADDTGQIVFNAETGKTASMTEKSYPYQGFPFGWEEHELMKQIHRGDALGIPGRLMDVFAGLSLVYLSASGLSMYADLLRRRWRGGRKQLFWT
jgi:uncharacterized iron-regulated membrane protein